MNRTYSKAARLFVMGAGMAWGQDLVPRAYLITPIGANAVTIAGTYSRGGLNFDPSLPIEDASGVIGAQVLSYYTAYGLFGRSSNVVVAVPYTLASFDGVIAGESLHARRSGMVDARVRFAINLRGGPAMRLSEFVKWRERTLIGVSLAAVFPTGQYDPARAINPGTNRWSVKPEVGFTRRRGRWVGEAYFGVWLFGSNTRFFPGNNTRTQQPTASLEMHLAYYIKPRMWISLDGNFYSGGRSTIGGLQRDDRQTISRMGVTFSMPITKREALKFSYSRGAYVNVGGNYHTVSAAWQYTWLRAPR